MKITGSGVELRRSSVPDLDKALIFAINRSFGSFSFLPVECLSVRQPHLDRFIYVCLSANNYGIELERETEDIGKLKKTFKHSEI